MQRTRFVFLFFALISLSVSETLAREWYQGGTLHQSTISQWASASSRDRLATAGDWAVNVLGVTEVRRIGKNGMLAKAASLVVCIDESIRGIDQTFGNLKVTEFAAICAVAMGWRKQE